MNGKKSESRVSRREFLGLSALGLGISLAGARAVAAAPNTVSPDEVAILYDPVKCVGCKACQMACKRWNKLPNESTDPLGIYESPRNLSAITWNIIKLRRTEVGWHFFNYQCMHCTDAACVEVCPTGALHHDPRGFVALDRDLCNGCGYCTQFCPYGVPHLQVENALTGAAKSAKCTFCQDRIRAGIGGPSCAEVCPVGALTWGKRGDLLEKARARVAELQAKGMNARIYGETEAGGLHRLSILLDEPEQYGLPSVPKTPGLARFWQRVVQPLGEVAFGAAIAGIFGVFLFVRRKIRMEEVK
ncbi:MAG: 4Fe-4S dicluster domain-containing protein [Thermoflexia bacterium]|nr:MAG: 4Fe-4S dicluster domain-containing protein [Thermoflexia bacterium]